MIDNSCSGLNPCCGEEVVVDAGTDAEEHDACGADC